MDASIGLGRVNPMAQGIEVVEVGEHRLHVDQLALNVAKQGFPCLHCGAYYRPSRRLGAIQ